MFLRVERVEPDLVVLQLRSDLHLQHIPAMHPIDISQAQLSLVRKLVAGTELSGENGWMNAHPLLKSLPLLQSQRIRLCNDRHDVDDLGEFPENGDVDLSFPPRNTPFQYPIHHPSHQPKRTHNPNNKTSASSFLFSPLNESECVQ